VVEGYLDDVVGEDEAGDPRGGHGASLAQRAESSRPVSYPARAVRGRDERASTGTPS
jgi:hypothetical protein